MKTRNAVFIILLLTISVFFMLKPKIKGELPEQFVPKQAKDGTGIETQHTEKTTNPELLKFINENLISGGPPKDGIPAIDEPKYVTGAEAEKKGWITPDELIFGFLDGSQAKALPRNIMYWHEIVNERINGEEVSITYCPLTGSIVGYKNINLGVSGKLYNSNLVAYDRATDSEIPQILGVGINGPLAGRALETFPVTVTTWKKWKSKHSDSLVLSRETGYSRNYDKSPYPGYDQALRVWFPLAAKNSRFTSKTLMWGITNNGEYLAIPKGKLQEEDTVTLGGDNITIRYDPELDIIHAYIKQKEIPAIPVYWFAWYAYYPQTRVWET